MAEGIAGLAADDQARNAAVDEGRAEPPAVGELADDGVGNELDRAVIENFMLLRLLIEQAPEPTADR